MAGVPSIYLASPRADERLCAAAAIAGVRGVLRVGGAQALQDALAADGMTMSEFREGYRNEQQEKK